jgi:hypothetical protein
MESSMTRTGKGAPAQGLAAETLGVDLRQRVAGITGQPVTGLRDLPGAGGYTPALRRIATLLDGTTVFVKAAVDEPTASWIRAEEAAYEALGGGSFMPAYVGGDDETLVLEDLRHGRWPPPWQDGDLDRVFSMLDDLSSIIVPSWAPTIEAVHGDLGHLWEAVAAHPDALLRTGVCSPSWLDAALPTLAAAASEPFLDGDGVVHFDARSDNLCLLHDRTVLVDWNLLCRGNPLVDHLFFAQTVTMDGGPPPWELLPDADPAGVAIIAGFFADRGPGPPIPTAPGVRPAQLAQLRICLRWAARALGLPPLA